MNYFEINFFIDPFEEYISDVLISELGEIGFDSFVSTETGLVAYALETAFGTGHHETTSLVIGRLLQMDLQDKTLLDMGCGTAVLAILAAMRGAKGIIAIDIDTWCTENSIENIAMNNHQDIDVQLGGAELLAGLHFDIVLANINRNILLADMEQYAACLSSGGELYMSGFYVQDIPLIEAEANRNGLTLIDYHEKNNWVAVKTVKN